MINHQKSYLGILNFSHESQYQWSYSDFLIGIRPFWPIFAIFNTKIEFLRYVQCYKLKSKIKDLMNDQKSYLVISNFIHESQYIWSYG